MRADRCQPIACVKDGAARPRPAKIVSVAKAAIPKAKLQVARDHHLRNKAAATSKAQPPAARMERMESALIKEETPRGDGRREGRCGYEPVRTAGSNSYGGTHGKI